jgi:hypothetical protein
MFVVEAEKRRAWSGSGSGRGRGTGTRWVIKLEGKS